MSNPQTPLHRSPPQFNIDSAPVRRRSAGQHAFSRERGQGLFLLLALLLFVGAGLIFSLARPAPPNIKNDKQTTAALAQAKAALIGYAAADLNRPGELPCPDVDNDGASTPISDYFGSNCVNLVGRLPWKTLGLPDLRDGGGERLWYALSDNFHAGATPPLNSDTMGQLTVTGGVPASNVVAIVFSPGEVLGTQVRDAANENNVANYLEGENANGDTIFTTGAASATFNDRLLVITNADLMPVVEQRVAREMMSILQKYKAATAALGYNGGAGVYPWADRSDGNSDGSVGDAYNHARFPCGTAMPVPWCSGGSPCLPPGTPALPGWLANSCTSPVTGWTSVIYYAVAQNRLQDNLSGGCTNCSASTLTVTNSSNRIADLCLTGTTPFACTPTVVSSGSADLVLITPGAATTYPRCASPPCWPTANFSPIIGYFEDPENSDNNDDNFVVPSSTNYDRDRIYIVR